MPKVIRQDAIEFVYRTVINLRGVVERNNGDSVAVGTEAFMMHKARQAAQDARMLDIWEEILNCVRVAP